MQDLILWLSIPGSCDKLREVESLQMGSHWTKLQDLAIKEVNSTLAELPGPLRERAQLLPVTFESRPNAALRRDGIERDTLGLFVGSEFADEAVTSSPLPPQIILFLENIWKQAEHDEQLFAEEVHTTYMHELGHYLGLDEDDLMERGLE